MNKFVSWVCINFFEILKISRVSKGINDYDFRWDKAELGVFILQKWSDEFTSDKSRTTCNKYFQDNCPNLLMESNNYIESRLP